MALHNYVCKVHESLKSSFALVSQARVPYYCPVRSARSGSGSMRCITVHSTNLRVRPRGLWSLLRVQRSEHVQFAPWRATSGMAPASSASSCSLAPTPHAVPPPQSSLWRAVPPPLIQPPPPRLSYQQRCRSQISLGIRGGCCSGCRIGCRCVRFPRRPRRDLSRRIERRRHLARRCSAAPARCVWCGISVRG